MFVLGSIVEILHQHLYVSHGEYGIPQFSFSILQTIRYWDDMTGFESQDAVNQVFLKMPKTQTELVAAT